MLKSLRNFIKESMVVESKISSIEDLYNFAKAIKIPPHYKFETEWELVRDFKRPLDKKPYDIVSITVRCNGRVTDIEMFKIHDSKIYRLDGPYTDWEIPENKLKEVLTFIANKMYKNEYGSSGVNRVALFLDDVINKL